MTSFRIRPLVTRRAFALALGPAPQQFRHPTLDSPWAFGIAVALLIATIVVAQPSLHRDAAAAPARRAFIEFPMNLDGAWQGRTQSIDPRYLESLQLDDYVMADFSNASGARVNLYSAYYASQLAGRSAHSPRSCLPGDGWRITELATIDLADPISSRPVPVNRAVIARGNDTQVVYYWFEQRGRTLANEYLVKWYLLVDALDTQRSDGALVRLSAPATLSGGVDGADATLRDFFVRTKARLPQFIPG